MNGIQPWNGVVVSLDDRNAWVREVEERLQAGECGSGYVYILCGDALIVGFRHPETGEITVFDCTVNQMLYTQRT